MAPGSSWACPEPGTEPSIGGPWQTSREATPACVAEPGATHIFTVDVSLTGAAEQLPSQEVPIVLQEGQVEVTEKLNVLVLHPQLLGGVPVNDLVGNKETGQEELCLWEAWLGTCLSTIWGPSHPSIHPFIHSSFSIYSPGVKSQGAEARLPGVKSCSALGSGLILGRLLNLSVPQFPHL